jgi:hypothetical protein
MDDDTMPKQFSVAMLWAGDRAARQSQKLEGTRLARVADALRDVGIAPEAAVYDDTLAAEVRDQLLRVDGVLVWVDPIVNGRDRSGLDALLRDVAAAGVFVSAHPDVILAMGTKEVLYRTRAMGWGCDTRRYPTLQSLRDELPRCLAGGAPRVLKQYRGNGGNGVWRVELIEGTRLRVRHAQRGSSEEEMELDSFLTRCEPYFGGSGRMLDQPYQTRLVDGMVRCYLVRDRVAGFGEQLINALFPAPPGAAPSAAPQPGRRLYYPPTRVDFQRLKALMETQWVAELCRTLALDRDALPVIWDADFLYGPKTAAGDDTYVLCEINVSSVYPFPDDALRPLAEETFARLDARRRRQPAPRP